jgi:hypothetical protein
MGQTISKQFFIIKIPHNRFRIGNHHGFRMMGIFPVIVFGFVTTNAGFISHKMGMLRAIINTFKRNIITVFRLIATNEK